ncbi:MAG TPA: serine hydrolase [Gemmatimonadales bacterium]|nr:serine hydrolase [Gemmatimonadales bacterium]
MLRFMPVMLTVLLSACGSGPVAPAPQDGATYWPGAEWRRARPAAVQLDESRLAGLIERLRDNRIPGINGLIVARQGWLAVEEYFNGGTASQVHTLQSVSKSVTSLLVGIAVSQGAISSLDQSVTSFFPEYAGLQNLDERKLAMTLRDLLTMRTGLDWSENPYQGSPLEQLNNSRGDWLRFFLDWPMREAPGSRFEYNSGGVIALGGVLFNTTGRPADAFAKLYLFDPIGVGSFQWIRGAPNGLPHMGGGLFLRAIDMARIGYLVLRKGKWGDVQVVPEAWLRASLTPQVNPGWTFAGHRVDYGYLWWLLPLAGAGPTDDPDGVIYTASGAQGQWIFVIPKYDMVVAVTSNTQQFDAPVRFLYEDILPAIR